jgi:4-hydroxy-tetrahydrodipicolinate synthase
MVATPTPFRENGDLDWNGVEVIIDWTVQQGMHGVAVAGTTGEWPSLTKEERKELFRCTARVVDGRVPILAGCTAFTPAETIEYATEALAAGHDGILLQPPPYIRPNDKELVAFFQQVSDAVEIPICLYNWPRGTGIEMSVEIQTRLAEVENVVAIKNSTERLDFFLSGFFALRDRLRYFGVPLTALGLALVRHCGADGTIGAGGILGSTQPDFFLHAWAGDEEAALRCGVRDALLASEWRNGYQPKFGSGPANMKAAFNLLGLPGGYPRPPLLPLSPDEIEIVRETLVRLDLLPDELAETRSAER